MRVIDFMPRRGEGPPRLMRIVEGLRGRVPTQMELSVRPDYASIVPWLESVPDGVVAVTGPDAFHLSTTLGLEIQDGTVRASFVALEGARERLALSSHLSYDVKRERQVGNFPQAFSHLTPIGAAAAISRAEVDAKVAAA